MPIIEQKLTHPQPPNIFDQHTEGSNGILVTGKKGKKSKVHQTPIAPIIDMPSISLPCNFCQKTAEMNNIKAIWSKDSTLRAHNDCINNQINLVQTFLKDADNAHQKVNQSMKEFRKLSLPFFLGIGYDPLGEIGGASGLCLFLAAQYTSQQLLIAKRLAQRANVLFQTVLPFVPPGLLGEQRKEFNRDYLAYQNLELSIFSTVGVVFFTIGMTGATLKHQYRTSGCL